MSEVVLIIIGDCINDIAPFRRVVLITSAGITDDLDVIDSPSYSLTVLPLLLAFNDIQYIIGQAAVIRRRCR